LLTEKVKEFVKQPVVMVSIREFQGFVVHILGQVNLPSFYRVPDGTSIQELITQSNGFTEFADPSSIMLIHKEDGKVETTKIDYSKFLKHNDMESNPVLKANDVVLVPRIGMKERIQNVVTITGQVNNPGTYELDAPMPLLDVLTLSGGALTSGDLRSVYILSRSEEDAATSRQVNLVSLLSGQEDPDALGPTIYPGEIVFIPSVDMFEDRMLSVNVIGQVTNPGVYQIDAGKRLIDAIFRAGGFMEDAAIDNLGIIHTNTGDSNISVFSLKDYILTGDIAANPVLDEGDTIVVPMTKGIKEIPPVQSAFSPVIDINVIGAISKPGSYKLSAGSNLLDVLVLAGGSASNADLERVLIIRGEDAPLDEGEQRFLVDLKAIMTAGNLEPLPIVFSGDTVFLPNLQEKGQSWWRSLMQLLGDITTIVVLYYLIVGRTYRR
jgi:protein involved in polysaccharide export with SLBB domain